MVQGIIALEVILIKMQRHQTQVLQGVVVMLVLVVPVALEGHLGVLPVEVVIIVLVEADFLLMVVALVEWMVVKHL